MKNNELQNKIEILLDYFKYITILYQDYNKLDKHVEPIDLYYYIKDSDKDNILQDQYEVDNFNSQYSDINNIAKEMLTSIEQYYAISIRLLLSKIATKTAKADIDEYRDIIKEILNEPLLGYSEDSKEDIEYELLSFITNIDSEVEIFKQELQDKENHIEKLESTITDLEYEIEKLNKTIDELEERIDDLNGV